MHAFHARGTRDGAPRSARRDGALTGDRLIDRNGWVNNSGGHHHERRPA
jgi:hypothetical protein